ncbi:TPA: hypothetical protein ACGF4N_003412, partial [Vibrio cholerae]
KNRVGVIVVGDRNISGINEALDFCEERLRFHQRRSQKLFVMAMIALMLGGVTVMYTFIGLFEVSDNNYSFLVFSTFFVVAFGVLIALHRYHLTEAAKYEHYKLAFARLNVASTYNERSEEYILAALTSNAFSISSSPTGKTTIQSPLPGHPGSDLSVLLVSKLLDNAKASNNKQDVQQ